MHEANERQGALGLEIRPSWRGARVAGPCRTVLAAPGDNLAVHHALERGAREEVLCMAARGGSGYGVFGEVMTRTALERGISGFVTSCGVRDVDAIEALGFPVFAAAHQIQGTVKRDAGRHNVAIRIGCALICPGDWLVGDADGCVAVPADRVESVLTAAEEKARAERRAIDAIAAGASSRTALSLP